MSRATTHSLLDDAANLIEDHDGNRRVSAQVRHAKRRVPDVPIAQDEEWEYQSENVPGNFHSVKAFMNDMGGGWELVAAAGNGGNYTVIIIRRRKQ